MVPIQSCSMFTHTCKHINKHTCEHITQIYKQTNTQTQAHTLCTLITHITTLGRNVLQLMTDTARLKQ